MSGRKTLFPKYTGETLVLSFDFAPLISDLVDGGFGGITLDSAVMSVQVFSGTDATPSAILSEAVGVSGYIATQKITAGVVGVVYVVQCKGSLNIPGMGVSAVLIMPLFVTVLPAQP